MRRKTSPPRRWPLFFFMLALSWLGPLSPQALAQCQCDELLPMCSCTDTGSGDADGWSGGGGSLGGGPIFGNGSGGPDMTPLHMGLDVGQQMAQSAEYGFTDGLMISEFADYEHALSPAQSSAIGATVGGTLASRNTSPEVFSDALASLEGAATQLAWEDSLMSLPRDTGYPESALPPGLSATPEGSDAHDSAEELGHDPVHPGTGEFRETWIDLELPGVGPAFVLQRVYRSRFDYDGPLGHGWDHSYNQRLLVRASPCGGEEVYWLSGRAALVRYEWTGSRYDSPQGASWTLQRRPEGWTLTSARGLVHAFDSQGLLREIRDALGRRILFGWTSTSTGPRLTAALDTLDRVIVFDYEGEHLAGVHVPGVGLSVQYDVDAAGDLVKFTSAAGVVESYAYAGGDAPAEDHVPTAAIESVCERRCGLEGSMCDARPACSAIGDAVHGQCVAACSDPATCLAACDSGCGPACETGCQSQCRGACADACDDWAVDACWAEVDERVGGQCGQACSGRCAAACGEVCEFYFAVGFDANGNLTFDGTAEELEETLESVLWFAGTALTAIAEGMVCVIKQLGSAVLCGLTFGWLCEETECSFDTTKKAWLYFCNKPCTACCELGSQCGDGVCMKGRNCADDCVDAFLYGQPSGLRSSCAASPMGDDVLFDYTPPGCIELGAAECRPECRALNCDCGTTGCEGSCMDGCAAACADPAPCEDYCGAIDFAASCEESCMDTCRDALDAPGAGPVYGRLSDLPHNLVSITDGEGRTWLVNTYGVDPKDASFDRVTEQLHGEDLITFEYYDRAHASADQPSGEDAFLVAAHSSSLEVCPDKETCVISSQPEVWVPVDETDFMALPGSLDDLLDWRFDPGVVDPIDPLDLVVLEVRDLFGKPKVSPPGAKLPTAGLPLDTPAGEVRVMQSKYGVIYLKGAKAAIYALDKSLPTATLTVVSHPASGIRVFGAAALGAIRLGGPGGCSGDLGLEPTKVGAWLQGDCRGSFSVSEIARRWDDPKNAWRGVLSDPMARIEVQATGKGLLERVGMTLYAGSADAEALLLRRYGAPEEDTGPTFGAVGYKASKTIYGQLSKLGDKTLALSALYGLGLAATKEGAAVKSQAPASVPRTRPLASALRDLPSFRVEPYVSAWTGGQGLDTTLDLEVTCYTDPSRFGRAKAHSGVTTHQPFALVTLARAGDALISYGSDHSGRVLRRVHHGTGDQRDYGYDATGRLLGVRSDFRDQTCLRYDDAGNVASTVKLPASGRYSSVEEIENRVDWYAAGRPAKIYAENSDLVLERFTWSDDGQLETHSVDASTWTYAYDGSGRLRDVYAPSGARTRVTYHAASGQWATQTLDADGPAPVTITVGRDALGRMTSVTRTGGPTKTFSYDPDGRLEVSTSVVDPAIGAVTTTWERDLAGRTERVVRVHVHEGETQTLTSETVQNLRGQVVLASASDGDQARLSCLRYDAQGRLEAIVRPEGNRLRYQRDPAGRVEEVLAGADFTLEGWSSPCLEAPREMPEGMESVLSVQRDKAGLPKSVTRDGVLTTYRYDGFGRPIETHVLGVARYRTGYDARGRVVWRATYRDEAAPGFVASGPVFEPDVLDPDLVRLTRYEWDDRDRLRKEIRAWFVDTPSGRVPLGEGSLTTTIDYADHDRIITVTDPEGRATHLRRDDLGRIEEVTRPGGLSTTRAYTDEGRVVTETWPAPTPSGLVTRTTTYDPLGAPLSVVSGGEVVYAAGYDALGRPLWEESGGERVHRSFDAFDQLREVRRASSGGALTELVAHLEWDRNGLQRSLQGADEDALTRFTYDHLDRRVRTDYPAGGARTRSFLGGARHPWQVTDRNGGRLTFTYDDGGRISQVLADNVAPGAAWSGDTVLDYVYGPQGLEWASTTGDPSTGSDDVQIWQRYDSVGDLVLEGSSLFAKPVERRFDGAGFERELNVGGHSILLETDAAGRIDQVFYEGAPVVTYQFDGFGTYRKAAYGNGLSETRSYDASGRATGYSREGGQLGVEWFFGEPGVTRIDEWGAGDATSSIFSRDPMGRLRTETHGLETAALPPPEGGDELAGWHQSTDDWRKVTIDASDNWTAVARAGGPTVYPYALADDRYTKFGSWIPSDPAGRQLGHGATKYRYDGLGQLVSVKEPDGRWLELSYDPLGRVVAWDSKDGGAVLQYAGGSIVRTVDEAGETVLVPGPMGAPVAFARGDRMGWLHYGLGTRLQATTNELGKPVSWWRWSAWGTPSEETLQNDPELLGYPMLLTGQPWFEAHGLHLQGARFYKPGIGRWLTPDPSGTPDGPNRYAYVGNRPLGFEDRSGLARENEAQWLDSLYAAGLDASGRPLVRSDLPWVDFDLVEGLREDMGLAAHLMPAGGWLVAEEAEAIVEGFINAPNRFDRAGQLFARATTQSSVYGVAEDLAAGVGEVGNGILGLLGPLDVLPTGRAGAAVGEASERVAREAGEEVIERSPRQTDGVVGRNFDSPLRAQMRAWRRLAGGSLADSDVLRRHWDDALAAARSAPNLTSTKAARRTFDNQRRRFWRRVRKDGEAVRMLDEAGLEFRGKAGTAPVWRDSGERLTIEHVERLADHNGRALDADNLVLSPKSENSNYLEKLRAHMPQLFEQ